MAEKLQIVLRYDAHAPYWIAGKRKTGAFSLTRTMYPDRPELGSFRGAPETITVSGISFSEDYSIADGDVWILHQPKSSQLTSEQPVWALPEGLRPCAKTAPLKTEPTYNRRCDDLKTQTIPNSHNFVAGSDPINYETYTFERAVNIWVTPVNLNHRPFLLQIKQATIFTNPASGLRKTIALDTSGELRHIDPRNITEAFLLEDRTRKR